MTRHVMTLYYQPTEEAKAEYTRMMGKEGQQMVFVNAGSIDASDDWVKKNVVFETGFKDNIADLNPHLCELTTYYCVWKNLLEGWSDDDFVQHSHYRKWLEVPEVENGDLIYATHDYPMVFQVGDRITETTVEGGFRYCHPSTSWDIMESVVNYFSTWREVCWWNDWKELPVMVAPLNLFKMKLGLFREWCEWIFPRAFDIERRIPYAADQYKTAYQRRALAFISERLFSFWCYCQMKRGIGMVRVPCSIKSDFKPITDKEERGMRI